MDPLEVGKKAATKGNKVDPYRSGERPQQRTMALEADATFFPCICIIHSVRRAPNKGGYGLKTSHKPGEGHTTGTGSAAACMLVILLIVG